MLKIFQVSSILSLEYFLLLFFHSKKKKNEKVKWSPGDFYYLSNDHKRVKRVTKESI